MRLSLVRLSLTVMAGCAAAVPAKPSVPSIGAPSALEFLRLAPEAMDVCALVTPAFFGPTQRSLAADLATVPRVIFEAPFVEQALMVERHDASGGRERTLWLRSNLRGVAFRRALNTLGARPLVFKAGRGVDGTVGGLEVALLAPGLARVTWPSSSRRAHRDATAHAASPSQRRVRAACARMIEAYPDATEIAVRGPAAYPADFGWPDGRTGADTLQSPVDFITQRLEGKGAELRLVREVKMAEGLLPQEEDHAPTVLMGGGLPAFALQALLLGDAQDAASDVSREREGRLLRLRARFAFTDLRLQREDRQRLRRAIRTTARASTPTPADRVDVTDLRAVRLHVRRWAAYAATQRGDRRRAALEQQLRLLTAALPQHPAESWLYDRVCEITLDGLNTPQTCAAWAERGMNAEPLLRASLQLWVRRASARLSKERLSEALWVHEVVPRTRSQSVAEALFSLVRQGASYDAAEGAYLAADMLNAVPQPRLRRTNLGTSDEAWPIESLPRTAAWLLSGVRAKAAGLYLRLSGDALTPSPEAVIAKVQQLVDTDAPTPQLVPVLGRDGTQAWVVALHASDDRAQYEVGGLLEALLSDGEIDVQITLVPLTGAHDDKASTMRLQGDLRGGALQVRKVGLRSSNGRDARVPWAQISRLLAMPLLSHVPRTFPMPELAVSLATPDEALVLHERLVTESGAGCQVSGPQLRCRAHAERPEGLIEAYRAFAMPQLVTY